MSILLRPVFYATLLYKPQKIALQALECRLPPFLPQRFGTLGNK